MAIEDILVNGPPWNIRVAVRAHVWAAAPDASDAYDNRAVLMMNTRWGRILRQEDYEDTQRAAAFDDYLEHHPVVMPRTSGRAHADAATS